MSVASTIGGGARGAAAALLDMVNAAGAGVALFLETVRKAPSGRLRTRVVLDQMYAGGVLTVPIVVLVGLFSGMVLTLQTGLELQKLGQQDLIGRIIAVAMCREMGPFVTGTILAAAVGSAMAAELGTMAVSDELTALNVMTVDTTRFLVIPRVVALALTCPILTIFADAVGIIGGGFVAVNRLGVGKELYIESAIDALRGETLLFAMPKDLYVGVVKGLVFGVTISIIGCASGMRAKNGAAGVGDATRRAVRASIMMIVVLNYVITGLFFR
jgi:phospholipid/cholesterol/gamma-HCH transport system permease protein